MAMRTLRTAIAEYDDGSEGVLEVRKLTPNNGDAFMTIGGDMGEGSIIVATPEQARQLINAVRAASKEIWDT